ncbi:hypothetical protein DL767_000147 [Monosporascus sp. MG133]|nr:hypothetical protein DL767_000147 [Monosporascus sp. MG133]
MARDICRQCAIERRLRVPNPCPVHPSQSSHAPPSHAYLYSSTLPPNTIRLLHIEPGSGEHPLSCRLVEQELGAANFNALSYTWGHQTDTKFITCDGQPLVITSNLFAALWRFREDGRLVPLWADAVCINQANITEKTHQVRMMREIYMAASLVLTWLGEEAETDAEGFLFLKELHERFGPSLEPHAEMIFATGPQLNLPPIDHPRWAALFKIFHRPYWFRSWIIQEIVYARECLVQCGTQSVSCDVILSFGLIIEKYKYLFDVMEGNIPYDGTSSFVGAPSMRELWYLKSSITMGEPFTILRLLNKTRMFNATQALDKIFALVALSSNVSTDIIDYGKSISEIQTQIAILSMEDRDSWGTDVLSHVDREHHAVDLPSWVPDWTNGGPRHNSLSFGLYPFGTTASLQEWKVLPGMRLELRGVLFDRVRDIVQEMPYMVPTPTFHDLDELYKNSRAMDAWGDACWALVVASGAYPTGENPYDVYWRTLAFNADSVGRLAPPELEESFAVWSSLFSDYPDSCDAIRQLREDTRAPTSNQANGNVNTMWGWASTILGGITPIYQCISRELKIAKLLAKIKKQTEKAALFEASFKRLCHGRRFCRTVNGM